jgi:hypothetical protein
MTYPLLPPDRFTVVDERRSGEDRDFLRVWHRRLRRRRGDGAWSAPFQCDSVERRLGMDAVAMVLHARGADGTVRVGLRPSLRPALALPAAALGVGAELEAAARLWEIPAGVLESGDDGEPGRRHRCSLESHEEMGLTVPDEAFTALGGPVVLSPGVMAERVWLYAAAVDPAVAGVPAGDGSPMEDDTEPTWLGLEAALAICEAGQADAKTEVALRRYAESVRVE